MVVPIRPRQGVWTEDNLVASSPELIAPGVHRVDASGLSNAINVLLLENDDGLTLVDTGAPNSVGRIREAIATLGSGPEDLKRIFLTHHHPDHAGGLPDLMQWAPQAELGAPPYEAEIISGRRARDVPSSAIFRPIARRQKVPTVPVGKVLREGTSSRASASSPHRATASGTSRCCGTRTACSSRPTPSAVCRARSGSASARRCAQILSWRGAPRRGFSGRIFRPWSSPTAGPCDRARRSGCAKPSPGAITEQIEV